MNLDSIFVLLAGLDKDILAEKVRLRKRVFKRTSHHVAKSRTTYLLLPPWHMPSLLFYFVKRKLKRLGFSYIHYDIRSDVLSPDVDSTRNYFKEIEKEIGADMKRWEERFNTEHFVIIGFSLGCVMASMVSGLNSKIRALILVVPGSSLAESLWRGLRTIKLKRVLRGEGLTLTELEKDWEELAPEQYVRNLKDKKVRVLLSRADKVIPYYLGKRFAEEIRKECSDVEIRENRWLGHYGTVLDFCLLSKDVVI